jgi:hypothetical protein
MSAITEIAEYLYLFSSWMQDNSVLARSTAPILHSNSKQEERQNY